MRMRGWSTPGAVAARRRPSRWAWDASGEVLVASFGSRRRRDFSVVGEAAGAAASLCSASGPGEILVSARALERVKESLGRAPSFLGRAIKFRQADP